MIWGHLSRDEIVGLVDRGDWGHPHLAACERCRRDVEELRAMVEELRGVPVPEPSPLFWDHLTRRVREAIEAEPPPRDDLRRRWWALMPATVVVAVAVGVLWWTLPPRPAAGPSLETSAAVTLEGLPPGWDTDDAPAVEDDSWDVVLALAEDVAWDNGGEAAPAADDAVGMGAEWSMALAPSSLDRALLALSDEERALVQALVAEEQGGGRVPETGAPQG